jgi:hypothetical protein
MVFKLSRLSPVGAVVFFLFPGAKVKTFRRNNIYLSFHLTLSKTILEIMKASLRAASDVINHTSIKICRNIPVLWIRDPVPF